MRYTVRPHAFSPPHQYILTQDSLVCEAGGERMVMPFESVESVCLSQAPTPFTDHRYTMQVTAEHGASFRIVNRSYTRLGAFEDRSADYAAFVRAFHAALIRTNRPVRYLAENSAIGRPGKLLLTVLGVVAVAAAAAMLVTMETEPSVFIEAALIVLAVPVAFALLRSGRRTTYDPRAIPPGLLPSGT